MKVIIYAVPTLNGIIAKPDEKDYGFISDKSWELYLKELKSAGVFVMGRRTYEASLRSGVFPYDCLNIIMTKQKIENKWEGEAIFTGSSPKKLLTMLEEKGFEKVIVTGGHLHTSFMKDGLVDEVWIHLMPKVITKGVNLFEGDYYESSLHLLSVKDTGDGELLLKYQVRT